MPNFFHNNFSATHIVAEGRKFLKDNNVLDYNISAVRLAEHCLNQPLYFAKDFNATQLDEYIGLLNKRISGVPLQHLLKRVNFRFLELESGPYAFIPRPETELIVDEVIAYFSNFDKGFEYKIVDLCTGSGNIAISIATEIPNSKVYAVEISDKALEIAERNNEKYGSKVEFFCDDATKSNWVEKILLKEREFINVENGIFDCIVSNPPYIPNDRVFDNEVLHDPTLALYGGEDNGLNIPRKIVDVAGKILKKGGLFIIEHDDTHQEDLHDYVVSKGFSQVKSLSDLNGFPRFIKAVL